MSQSRSAVGAHKVGWHKDHNHVVRKGKESKRTSAKRQVRDSTDKALVSGQSADHKCMPEHSDVTKPDNWIEKSPTDVHMKPFSMTRHLRHLGSTNSCPTADAK